MDRTVRLFGRLSRMQGTFFSWKTGSSTSWSGAEKIRLFVDDSEIEVKESWQATYWMTMESQWAFRN